MILRPRNIPGLAQGLAMIAIVAMVAKERVSRAADGSGSATPGDPGATRSAEATFAIDLPTALRLAGAENLDVQLARERVNEARAVHEQMRLQYFPWLAPGVGYRGHTGNIQDVAGNVFEADKQSYTAGLALNAQLNLGEAIYQSLAARQRARAAEEGLEARRQETVFLAAVRYFELARAVAALAAAAESVRIAEDYSGQVGRAVEAGIAFKGDAFRTEVQLQKNRVVQRQAEEQRRVASARLAETLRLAPVTDLAPAGPAMVPVRIVDADVPVGALVAQAAQARPELRQSSLVAESTDAERKGAVRGPWIPTLGAQAYVGGLGGGRDGHLGSMGDTEDFFLGLGWRIGPGGLFDRGRVRAAESRHRTSLLELEKVRIETQRQVVEAQARCRSFADQLGLAERAVSAAQQLHELSRERKEFGVGAVLETIQAEQELTRARLDYFQIVAAHNQAQFGLRRALGQ